MSKPRTKRQNFFTVVELLIVAAVLLMLVALIVPVIRQAGEKSAQINCINNLRSLSLALQMHYNRHQLYPKQGLQRSLAEYTSSNSDALYCCPSTGRSYDTFYVARDLMEDSAKALYSIGCPHHRVVNLGVGKGTRQFEFGRITYNGKEISIGSEVGDGTLKFEDGSEARISGGKATVVSSFRNSDGVLYTILRILEIDIGTIINARVTPGSAFEVVTPAAIAGVEGTVFTVETSKSTTNDEFVTKVIVDSGVVKVTGRGSAANQPEVKRVKAGESVECRANGRDVQRDGRNNRGGNNRGGNGDDDDDDE